MISYSGVELKLQEDVMVRIAIIEDDRPTNDSLKGAILDAWPSYLVDQCFDRSSAELALASQRYDLIVLDLELNRVKSAGIGIINTINKSYRTPVVVVSGMPGDIYKSIMRELDAWDYLQKPFDPQALLTVIDMALRSTRGDAKSGTATSAPVSPDASADSELSINPLELANSRWRGKKLGLTLTQQRIAYLLYENKGRLVATKQLYDLLATGKNAINVRAHISSIRESFRSVDPTWNKITTVPGQGYRWEC
jgi:DNA-binding response OmpR family regulator